MVVVWDAANGKELRRLTDLPALSSTGSMRFVAVSPDQKLLALPLREKVVLIDLATGQEARPLEGADEDRPALLFAPDGKSLIGLAGNNETLAVWDVATGKLVRHFGKAPKPLAAREAYAPAGFGVALSPDGKALAWGDGPTLRVVDVATGKEPASPGSHTAPLREVTFAPDGKTLWTRSEDGTTRRWDAATGKEAAPVVSPGKSHTLTLLSPDGRVLAVREGGTLRLRDAAGGKELHALEVGERGMTAVFSPDGRTLAAVGWGSRSLRLYDVGTGKEKRTLTLPGPEPGTRPPRWLLWQPIFSADGRLLATPDEVLTVWDLAGGREPWRVPLAKGATCRHAAFSPDGRTLAVESAGGRVALWELASHKQRAALPPGPPPAAAEDGPAGQPLAMGLRAYPLSLAFAPGGRLLAQAGEDHKVHLWDLRTGREAGAFAGHRGHLASVTFAPDGRRLASAGLDTTALVWDVAPLLKKLTPPAALGRERAEACWADLAGADAAKAYDAVRALAGDPRRAAALLGEHLKPAAPPDEKRLKALLADLDGDDFATRDRARKELEGLGELAAAALRQALKGEPSPELRRQAEELLGTLPAG